MLSAVFQLSSGPLQISMLLSYNRRGLKLDRTVAATMSQDRMIRYFSTCEEHRAGDRARSNI